MGNINATTSPYKAQVCVVAKLCLTLCDPMDCSLPGSLSMGFSRQEYWSSLPFPPTGRPRFKVANQSIPFLEKLQNLS